VICFSLSAAASPEAMDSEQNEFRAGKLLWTLSEFPPAIKHFSNTIDQKPSDGAAHFYRGMAYTSIKRFREAIADFGSSIQFGYLPIVSLERRASIFLALRRPEQAVADCTQAIALEPRSRMAYSIRSRAYQALNRRELSFQDQHAYAKTIPTPRELLDSRRASDDIEKKISVCKRAVSKDPNLADGWLALGILQLETDEASEALTSLNQVVQLDKDSLEAHYYRARASALLSKYQDAEKDLTLVISRAPDCFWALKDRAKLYDYDKKLKEAKDDLTRALKVSMTESENASVGADAKYRSVNLGRARMLLKRRALIYSKENDAERALQDLDASLRLEKRSPENSVTDSFYRASVFQRSADYQKAIDELAKIISIHPQDDEMYLRRATFYLKLKLYKEAIADFKEVLQLNGEDGVVRFLIARCYNGLGDKEAAVEEMKRAKALGFDQKSYYENLERHGAKARKAETKPRQ
jgi:tetratricopeptide (TPR) repeat protein